MRSGELRHKIGFYKKIETKNDIGEIVTTLELIGERYAKIKGVSGDERFLSNQTYSEATSIITCRFIEITTKDVIKFGKRVFDIIYSSNKDNRDVELEIVVRERIWAYC